MRAINDRQLLMASNKSLLCPPSRSAVFYADTHKGIIRVSHDCQQSRPHCKNDEFNEDKMTAKDYRMSITVGTQSI